MVRGLIYSRRKYVIQLVGLKFLLDSIANIPLLTISLLMLISSSGEGLLIHPDLG